MRLFTYILSFHILLLALEPGLNVLCLGECKTECCGEPCQLLPTEKPQSEQQPFKKDSSNQTTCNPFTLCNACSGFTVGHTFIISLPEINCKEQHISIIENFPSKIAFDFWQPPKIS